MIAFSGKWTEEEEKRLAEVVHELTSTEPGDIVTQGVSWAAVAERVGTRSEKQCRSKWLNYLNWKQSGGTEWTKEDEINLILRFVSHIFGHESLLRFLIDFPLDFLECLMKGRLTVESHV
jgi:hypothetical protein